MAEHVEGPDFICFGQQKAGTTWLYDQLAVHPSFWMPPSKELHYFDVQLRPRVWKGRSERPGEEGKKHKPDRRDEKFLEAALKAKGTAYDFGLYRGLFAMKGARVSGDITPGYSILARPDVERVVNALPDAKILLLIRDPVQRFWSMLRMMVGQNLLEASVATDWRRLKTILSRDGVRTRSFATQLWDDWRGAAGPERTSFYFFDDIVKQPDALRATIIEKLGGNPALPSAVPLDYNSNTYDVKLEMGDDIRRHLAEHFAEELQRGAEIFGGHAAEWPKKYAL